MLGADAVYTTAVAPAPSVGESRPVQRLTPLTLSAALVTAGVAYMATGDAVAIAGVAGSLLAGSIPFDTIALDALGVFSIAATVAGVGLLALLVAFVSLLVRFPMAAVSLIGQSASRAVADAERTKLLSIRDRPDIARVVARIAQQSRRVIAPRLRAFLGNSLVLAYRDDPAAARRFARALRWRMLRVAR